MTHGTNRAQNLPFCQPAKTHGSFPTHTFWKGHCRQGGYQRFCVRWNFKAGLFFALVAPELSGPAALDLMLAPNSTAMSIAKASETEELLMIVWISERNISTVVPGVGCFSDADCELSARAWQQSTAAHRLAAEGLWLQSVSGLTVTKKFLDCVYVPIDL